MKKGFMTLLIGSKEVMHIITEKDNRELFKRYEKVINEYWGITEFGGRIVAQIDMKNNSMVDITKYKIMKRYEELTGDMPRFIDRDVLIGDYVKLRSKFVRRAFRDRDNIDTLYLKFSEGNVAIADISSLIDCKDKFLLVEDVEVNGEARVAKVKDYWGNEYHFNSSLLIIKNKQGHQWTEEMEKAHK